MQIMVGSAQQMHDFGVRLGSCLFAGAIVALNGTLGAGKTCLTRGIAEGLQVNHWEKVNSPTFVLVQEYPGPLPLFHFDVYRLSHPSQFAELGVEEYFAGQGVCVIEWAERVLRYLPADYLSVTIEPIDATTRRLRLTAIGKKYESWLARLSTA